MKEKIKNILALVLLLLLLPYVITVLMTGKMRQTFLEAEDTGSFISVEVDGKVREINFEDYVMGVTALQIPSSYEIEAIKTQMVVARTNLTRNLQENSKELLKEKYLTEDQLEKLGIWEKFIKAKNETKGQVLTYKDQPLLASYHSVSAGRTRNGNDVLGSKDFPYLKSVQSAQDVEADRYLHAQIYSPAEILAACRRQYPDIRAGTVKEEENTGEAQTEQKKENDVQKEQEAKAGGELTEQNLWDNMEIVKKDSSDYVLRVRIGNTEIPGEEFRKFLNLNSSCFTMDQVDSGIRITTKGLGHGVGLSQYGAQRMSESGKSYQDILHYYYHGVTIQIPVKETEKS